MKIAIDFTKDDFWKFNKYALFHLPKYKGMILSALIGIPIISIAVFKILGWGWISSIIGGLVIGGLCDLFFVYRLKRKIMSMVKYNDGILGERTIEIDENGLSEYSPKIQSRYEWSAMHQLTQDAENLYLFINDLQAVVVPKRYFANPEEETAFTRLVGQYSGKSFQA